MHVKSITEGEHSAILSTFIKLPFVINIFVLSNFECLFYTGFNVIVVVGCFQGTVEQNNVGDPSGIQLDLDTAVIPLDQGPKQNGTLHSRGNSADLT